MNALFQKVKIKIQGCLLICLALGVMGCGRSTPQKEAENEPVVEMLTIGSSGKAACARISKALSEITSKKLGISVNITQKSMFEIDNELSGRMMKGEAPDLFCYANPQDMLEYVDAGYTWPLNQVLDQYWEITGNVADELWACVTINNSIYAVPGNNNINYSSGFVAKKEIIDELSVDTAEITTLEELHEVLLEVKKRHPDMAIVVPHFGETFQTFGQDPLGDNLGVLLDNKGTTVENLFTSTQYEEICRTAHQWYEEGLIIFDPTLEKESSQSLLNRYNGLGYFIKLNQDNLASAVRNMQEEAVFFDLGDTITNSSAVNIGWCVASASTKKQEAMELLALIYSNQEVADLCIYGEEGIDYTRLDKYKVTETEEIREDTWSTIAWGWPNRKVASEWVLPGKNLYQMPTKAADRSAAMGFMFDSTPVQFEVNRCKNVVDKYHRALTSGYLDPEDALPKFQKELEEAGIDTVIKEKQGQLKFWMNSKMR